MRLKVLIVNNFFNLNYFLFLIFFFKKKKKVCCKFMFDKKEKKLKDYVYKRIIKICFNKQGDKDG